MGVHPLDLDTWLVVDHRREEELVLKARLATERADEVFLAHAGSEHAGAETLELITAWLARHAPQPTRPTREGPVGASCQPDAGGEPGEHPLAVAGRLVQEDLCLLRADDEGRHTLVAGSVSFPSHWRLGEKMGRSLAAIHAPVDHYAAELEARVDTFFARLRPERPVVRRNFSIHCHADLFRPERHESPDSYGPDATSVAEVWLRSERQTLLRLPRTGAVLFTIKTQLCAMPALVARPDVAHRLGARLRSEAADHGSRRAPLPFPRWLPEWLASR
jgi:hypothetical protein